MNKIIKSCSFLILFIIAVSFNSCDSFESFPINVPIAVTINTSGNNTTISESTSFCLMDFSEYQDYRDDMQSVQYVTAAFRTVSASQGLTGDIVVTLQESPSGTILFQITIPNVQPADYIQNPYVIQLGPNEVTLINLFLGSIDFSNPLSDVCFTATLSVQNISGGSTPYSLQGVVEIVFEAETSL